MRLSASDCFDLPLVQGVACSVVELELQTLGFVSTFEPMDISSPDKQWDGVRRRYFQADTYYLPHCVFVGKAAAAAAAAETAASTVADGECEGRKWRQPSPRALSWQT